MRVKRHKRPLPYFADRPCGKVRCLLLGLRQQEQQTRNKKQKDKTDRNRCGPPARFVMASVGYFLMTEAFPCHAKPSGAMCLDFYFFYLLRVKLFAFVLIYFQTGK